MNWPVVSLGEIFEIARGGSPRPIDAFISEAPDSVPWISIRDASESAKYICKTRQRIRVEGVSRSRIVNPGDFLLTNSMSFGRPYISKIRGCIHDGWLVLSGRSDTVDQDYFYHLLSSDVVYRQFAKLAAGAVVKNLNIDLVRGVTVPLPPLLEQRRIADMLDKADAIRRKRKEAIALTEELLRSTFLDMFGDPVTNPKGWETCNLEDLCSSVVDCPHTTPTYSGTPRVHPCVRTSDLQYGFLDWSTTKYVDPAEYAQRIARLRPEPGDVLYSREGERFGIGALIPDGVEACLGQRMMLLRAEQTVASPAYVWGTLNSAAIYRQAVAEVGGSTSPHVNVKAIRRFRVCRPPLPMQAKYSEVYSRAVALRERHLGAVGEAGELFSSLVQRAFSGQLTNVKARC
jgi:type I restriction enzyme S subunit